MFFAAPGGLVEQRAVKCVIYALSLRVCELRGAPEFQEDNFDHAGGYHDELVEVVVGMVVEEEVDEEVLGQVDQQQLAAQDHRGVQQQKHPEEHCCLRL